MATLVLKNNTVAAIFLSDVGVEVPVAGDTYNDPMLLEKCGESESLRTSINAGDITANDGTIDLTASEALVYLSQLWSAAGRASIISQRVLQSGTTVVANTATVTLATLTRDSKEVLQIYMFLTDGAASDPYAEGVSAGPNEAAFWFEATGNPNEVNLQLHNRLGASRTFDWAVVGVRV